VVNDVAMPRDEQHRRSATPLVLLALVPALAWGTLLVVGSQLHENLCSTGATPHRGTWFGLDLRVPTIVLGVAAAILTLAAGVTLMQIRREAVSADSGDVNGTRAFVAMLGLVSVVFFLLIIAASIVSTAVNPRC
jgi:hypothetical protein